jgi:hypothetical protein
VRRSAKKSSELAGFWARVWERIWGRLSSQATEFWNAHRSAYSWFELTIECPGNYREKGFNKSPLLHQTQPANTSD